LLTFCVIQVSPTDDKTLKGDLKSVADNLHDGDKVYTRGTRICVWLCSFVDCTVCTFCQL